MCSTISWDTIQWTSKSICKLPLLPYPPWIWHVKFFLEWWAERKRGEYWGEGEYSTTVVSLSTSCSPLEIKEWRVVSVLEHHPFPSEKRQLWREPLTYYSAIESTVACKTGIISVSFRWKETKARLAWSASHMRGEEGEKITPVHIPLFKQSQCSNMNTATQSVTLHCTILKKF